HPDKNDDNPEKDILEDNFKKLSVAWTAYKLFYETFEDSSSEECDSSENTNKSEMDSGNLDETEMFCGNLDETEMFSGNLKEIEMDSGNLDETKMFSGNLKEIEMAGGDLKETKESVFRCESQKDENCNLENCINELCRILGCNISELTYKELSSLVKKRSISLRPQNNETNPRKEFLAEQLKELEEVWQIYKTLRPGCSHDESSGSEEEFQEGGEDSYADNTGYSEEFFKISPEKQYDFPEFMKVFFRSESCRRAGKQIIVCVPNKSFVKEAFVLHFLPWDHLSVFIHSDVTIISINEI
ncbi:hypothetical protein AVEN_271797-1, partial [Araneus ventricosus]